MRKINSGKVRDIYEVSDNEYLIVVSDRISAFDVIMNDIIPDKGIILNKMSEFWFNFITDIVPNHVIATDFEKFPEEFRSEQFKNRSMLVKKLNMLPVECVVRGYISGSSWAEYKKSGSVCGIVLPPGITESQKLPEPLFTPAYKAELGKHDENITFGRACELISRELAEKMRRVSIEIYKKCTDYALEKGIIIADTKFEFGLDENGRLTLGDEALTPDSSRFWPLGRYETGRGQDSFDKQPLRDWLAANGYRDKAPEHLPREIIELTRAKYLEAFERLTGKTL